VSAIGIGQGAVLIGCVPIYVINLILRKVGYIYSRVDDNTLIIIKIYNRPS